MIMRVFGTSTLGRFQLVRCFTRELGTGAVGLPPFPFLKPRLIGRGYAGNTTWTSGGQRPDVHTEQASTRRISSGWYADAQGVRAKGKE